MVQAIERRIEEEAAARVEEDDEDRERLARTWRRHFNTARAHADSRFQTFVTVLRDNVLGKIKREVGQAFLRRLAVKDPTNEGGRLYTAYLDAIRDLRRLCDDASVPDERFVFRNVKLFGSKEANLRNALNLADS